MPLLQQNSSQQQCDQCVFCLSLSGVTLGYMAQIYLHNDNFDDSWSVSFVVILRVLITIISFMLLLVVANLLDHYRCLLVSVWVMHGWQFHGSEFHRVRSETAKLLRQYLFILEQQFLPCITYSMIYSPVGLTCGFSDL